MIKTENSVKKNYLYNLFYQILCIIIPFITTPYISRVLGTENTGVYSFVNANMSYFFLIGINGLTTYAQLEVAKRRDDEDELKQFFLEIFIAKLITMSISILVYMGIYVIRQNPYRIYYMIQLSALVCGLIDVTWLFQGVEDFKIVIMQQSVVKILSVVGIFLLVKNKEDLYLYLIINGFGSLAGSLALIPRLRKYVTFSFVRKPDIGKHIRESFQFFLPAIASTLMSTIDKLMIGWNSGSKVQNGYYERAVQIETMIFMFFGSLNLSLRPRMAYLFKNERYWEIKERMKTSLQFISLLVFPSAMGLAVISDLFVYIFLGQEFMPVANLLKIMAAWIICKAVSNCLCEQYILPNKGIAVITKIIWVSAMTNIMLNVVLIHRFEAIGATVASLITETIFLAISYCVGRGAIEVIEYIKLSWKYIVAAGVMFCLLWRMKVYFPMNLWGMFCEIGTGATIYFILLFLMGDKFVLEQIKKTWHTLINKKRKN